MSDHAHDIPKLTHRLRFSSTVLVTLVAVIALGSDAAAKNGGWDLEPYHIQVNIALDAPGGLSEYLATELPHYLAERVEASLAPLWTCDVKVATGADRAKLLSAIATADPPPPDFAKDKDKLMIAVVRT